MAKIELLNINREKIKDINIDESIWNIKPNDVVLYDAIILSQASLRQGTHSTKTRAERKGGGRKPWRQKGTGRARAGSTRSPIWRKGGIVFGPKPRDYDKKMNKKERRLALKSALTYKFINKEIIVVDQLALADNKTKTMIKILTDLNLVNNKVLVVVKELNDNLYYATRNIGQIKVIEFDEVNTLDIVTADKLLIEETALQALEEGLK